MEENNRETELKKTSPIFLLLSLTKRLVFPYRTLGAQFRQAVDVVGLEWKQGISPPTHFDAWPDRQGLLSYHPEN